ncbi:MAG: branched-chain amino acid ABC transporter permease [Christensenellales bacterium]|jgi:branched-chain amino acid transport system permease protein
MLDKIFNACVKYKVIIYAVVSIFAIIFPLVFTSAYAIRIGTVCLMYIMLALSLNLLTGVMGQMSFGHAAFWGVGAYTAAILSTRMGFGTELNILAAVIICGIFGLLVGLPVLKLSGAYLTLVTLGFCEIIRMVELNWMDLTRGPLGIARIPKPSFFGIDLKTSLAIYFLIFVLMLITLYIVKSLIDSKFGRAIKAIRDDDIAAASMGVNVFKTKVIVFVVSSMLAGVAGAFYAQYIGYIDPSSFTTNASLEILIMVIFGGLGSIVGTIFGSVFLIVLPELLRGLMEYRMLIYGILIVVLMLVKPTGLFGNINFKYIEQRLRAHKDDEPDAALPDKKKKVKKAGIEQ